ncbi:DUF6053 domain-containing protein [Lysobacter enzymogenes]|uniref:DUF6053 domain-containing protein n=1 Tax=Lysobacter enzymogenes TaxID=69 RepID=UPI003396BB75
MGGPSGPRLLAPVAAIGGNSVGPEGPPTDYKGPATGLWAAHLRIPRHAAAHPSGRPARRASQAPRGCDDIARAPRRIFRCADLPPSSPLDTLPCSPSPSAPATLPLAGTRWRWTTSASAARGRTTSRTSISICRATS